MLLPVLLLLNALVVLKLIKLLLLLHIRLLLLLLQLLLLLLHLQLWLLLLLLLLLLLQILLWLLSLVRLLLHLLLQWLSFGIDVAVVVTFLKRVIVCKGTACVAVFIPVFLHLIVVGIAILRRLLPLRL
jgi:hypothetical protein